MSGSEATRYLIATRFSNVHHVLMLIKGTGVFIKTKSALASLPLTQRLGCSACNCELAYWQQFCNKMIFIHITVV